MSIAIIKRMMKIMCSSPTDHFQSESEPYPSLDDRFIGIEIAIPFFQNGKKLWRWTMFLLLLLKMKSFKLFALKRNSNWYQIFSFRSTIITLKLPELALDGIFHISCLLRMYLLKLQLFFEEFSDWLLFISLFTCFHNGLSSIGYHTQIERNHVVCTNSVDRHWMDIHKTLPFRQGQEDIPICYPLNV